MNVTILIVEDNDRNRLLLRDILTYNGYAVLEARDGSEGVQMARDRNPEVVLMDIQMPNVDGLTAGRMLKGDPATRHLKLVALTSFAMRGDREKILGAGFDGYMAKPIDTRALPRIIKGLLEAPGAPDDKAAS